MSIQIMPSLFKANNQYSALSGRNNNRYSEFMRIHLEVSRQRMI